LIDGVTRKRQTLITWQFSFSVTGVAAASRLCSEECCRPVDQNVSPSWLLPRWFVVPSSVAQLLCRPDDRTPAFPAIAGTRLPTRRNGQAELAWVAGYVVRQFTCPKAVTHPNTNRAQCRATYVDRDQRVTATLNQNTSRQSCVPNLAILDLIVLDLSRGKTWLHLHSYRLVLCRRG